jgi:mRNA-degrading endonuclease RelE of RelBE toxin-antitoxin system
VFQIIFNEISAAEISQLPTMTQLEVLNEFQVSPADLEKLDGENDEEAPFGKIERDGEILYRYRAKDLRIYFEVTADHQAVVVHRVLNKNTFQDFLYRTNLPVGEDEALSESKQFWELIEEGEKARRV